jgi:CRP-like cAMP-binding protein
MITPSAAHAVVLTQGWLSTLPAPFQREVLSRCHVQAFEAGQSIYVAGAPAGGIYGLISGRLAISISPTEQGPYIAHFARPGAWYGEGSALTDEPRRVGLAATRNTVVLHLPLHAIGEIAAREPSTWRYIARITVAHLDVAIGACDDLMIRDHKKRCVAVLLRLAGCRTGPVPTDAVLEIEASHTDIAVLSNVSRSTIGSYLHELREKGLIKLDYRKIVLNDITTIRSLLVDER